MKAILFACVFLIVAVTTISSAPARSAPQPTGMVLADGTAPVHTLDLKNSPAGSDIAEYVIDTPRRHLGPSGTNTYWRVVEGQRILFQMPQPSLFGWVHYPMRN